MSPGTFLTVLVVGLLAGWLAGFFMKDSGLFATMAVAFVGAAGLIGVQRRFWHGVPLKKGRPAAGRRRS